MQACYEGLVQFLSRIRYSSVLIVACIAVGDESFSVLDMESFE